MTPSPPCVPQARDEEYRRGTDVINSVVFPGSCCPSLTALLEVCHHHDAMWKGAGRGDGMGSALPALLEAMMRAALLAPHPSSNIYVYVDSRYIYMYTIHVTVMSC